MDHTQKKYLLERLTKAIQDRNNQHYKTTIKEPDEVKKAQRLLTRWNRHVQTRCNRNNKKFRKQISRVKEVIYFGDEKTALRLLKEFEKKG